MNIKNNINPSDYEVGVIIGRFQTNRLHEGHINLISQVLSKHKKTIVLVGVSRIQNTKQNPLDFASRKSMIQELFPSIVVLPIMDQRYDDKWSQEVDSILTVPFGEKKIVIYGSRDSFIPYYTGRYPVIELEASSEHSATNIREEIAKETLETSDFRAGVIYSVFNQRPVTYPTVDVTSYNDKGEILMAKKPNEPKYRFIGGFVDRTDESWEQAAKREFFEETGGNGVIDEVTYVASSKINDWRYSKTESGIMTTLFIGKFLWGKVEASDDIASLHWLNPKTIKRDDIMIEHQELFDKLIDFLDKRKVFELELSK